MADDSSAHKVDPNLVVEIVRSYVGQNSMSFIGYSIGFRIDRTEGRDWSC
jgi:hypothetical protein